MIIAYTTVYTQCTQARARAHIVHMYEVFIILIFLLFSCPFYSMRSIFLYFRNLICIVRQVFSRIFLEVMLLRDGYVTTLCFSLPYMLCNFISYSVRILMNYKISPNSPKLLKKRNQYALCWNTKAFSVFTILPTMTKWGVLWVVWST